MDYGICLPNFRAGSGPEGIDAAAEVAVRLGWSTCWTTDHVLVDRAHLDDYGRIYEAIITLAWVAGRHAKLRLGTSVIVVPPRNAVLLAKELATLDDLSGGRAIAGVGVGWNRTEFGNMAMAERFKVRGAYLAETIALWRHLWSGSTEPFEGRFHAFHDFVFEPLPPQGAGLPIYVGGGSKPALERAGRLADAYHSSAVGPAKFAERAEVVRGAAKAVGRPTPALTARVRVRFDEAKGEGYAMRGTPEQIAVEVKAWADLGVSHLALWLGPTDPDGVVAAAERFASEVAPLV